MRSLYVLCALVALSPAAGWSQETRPAESGERVRVRVTDIDPLVGPSWLFGAYGGTRHDSILIMRGSEERFVYPVDSIRELDAFRCCKSASAGMWRGALWGAAVGTVIGAGSAWLGCATDRYLCDMTEAAFWGSFATFTLSRIAVGALVGAAWGAWRPGKTWFPLVVPDALHLEPTGGNTLLQVGLSLELPR